MLLVSSTDFFHSKLFYKKSFRITISVVNGLDPDQDRHNVGPDLGPNCLRMTKVDASKERVKFCKLTIHLSVLELGICQHIDCSRIKMSGLQES